MKWRVILHLCGVCVAVIGLLAIIKGGRSMFAKGETYGIAGEAITVTTPISELKIDWISGGIDIGVHDGLDVVFSEESNRELSEKQRLRYTVDGERLTISFCAPGINFGVNANKRLTVLLPRKALELVNIDNVSGEVRMAGITAEEIKVETVSGKLTLDSIAADTLRINAVSAAANIVLSAPPQLLKMDSVSGHCELALPEGCGFTAQMDSVSGKLRCDFADVQGGKKLVYGDGAASLGFNSVSGHVEISFAEPAPVVSVPTAVPAATKEAGDTAPASGRSF
ncbi:MAG: DUF4097 domain-containing protein [Oscillospiraceae bacterium]|jgi:hypothetical protein|nr:DUF4097 domain-containing protein [Oscillospiraceae bacterium]